MLLRIKILFLIYLSFSWCLNLYAQTPEEIINNLMGEEKQIDRMRDFFDNFTTYLELKESFNDNIFRTSEDIEGDLVSELSAGLKFGDPVSEKKTIIFADGGVLLKQYSEHDEHNVENPYFGLMISHGLGQFAAGLEYTFIKDQSSLTDVSNTAREGFVDYFQHYSRLNFDVNWNRFLWQLAYSHNEEAYEEEDNFKTSHSYKEDLGSFTGSLKVFPKTYFFLEYDRTWKDYNKGGSVDRAHDTYWIGINGKISPKVNGLIKFGYEEGHFPEEHKSSSAVNINLDYKASKRLAYNLEIERGVGSSSVSSDELDHSQRLALGCSYLPPFNKKLKLMARISLDSDEYESGREDKGYDFVLSSEYSFKHWLKLIAEYQFEKDDSDVTLAEYENNIVSFKIISEF